MGRQQRHGHVRDMFDGAHVTFNQDISSWDVSSATNMRYRMFELRRRRSIRTSVRGMSAVSRK